MFDDLDRVFGRAFKDVDRVMSDVDRIMGRVDRMMREVDRAVDRAFEDGAFPPRNRSRRETSTPPPNAGPWARRLIGYAELKELLTVHARAEHYPSGTPQEIDLGPLHHYLRKLWSHTEPRGVEYGRAGVLDLNSGELELSRSEPGSASQCRITAEYSHFAGRRPVLTMHTHPLDRRGSEAKKQVHFSAKDFAAFIATPSLLLDFVVSGDEVLLSMKTAAAARGADADAIERRLKPLLRECIGSGRTFEAGAWEFTRSAALELGCSLYRTPRGSPQRLRKVDPPS